MYLGKFKEVIFQQQIILSIESINFTSSQCTKLRQFFHRWEIVYCGSPKNSQNDLVYVAAAGKHRSISASHLLYMHRTFSKSVTSLLRYQNWAIPTSFSPNTALKSTDSINKKCCWCKNCCIAGDVFVFQQDNAPTHRTHDMVELLCRETPETPHSLIVTCSQPTLLT